MIREENKKELEKEEKLVLKKEQEEYELEIKREKEQREALEANQAKIEKLPELEQDMVKVICLYSLMQAKVIGPIIADLMSSIEKEPYKYYEVVADKVLDENDQYVFDRKSKREMKPQNQFCQYVIAKEEKMKQYQDSDKTVRKMEDENDALILHESKSPISMIPLFDKDNYMIKVEHYKKYPYVLEFLDYVITRKAQEYDFALNTYPMYTSVDLYRYLNEYLNIYSFQAKEKQNLNTVVKKLVLTKKNELNVNNQMLKKEKNNNKWSA